MDQYITIYQKDFTWPSTVIKRTTAALNEADFCKCTDAPKEIKPLKHCGDDYDWSRTGPMGRLLDPKLYPAKTGPYPETEATKFNQPSTYMKKLEEKYPNLYGILQTTPMDEIIKRVDEDRLRTTYQIDYSERASADIAQVEASPCAAVQRQEKFDCGSPSKSEGMKKRAKQYVGECKIKKKSLDDEQETRLPPWRSEYQDGISKLGQAIMKVKIHSKKKQSQSC